MSQFQGRDAHRFSTNAGSELIQPSPLFLKIQKELTTDSKQTPTSLLMAEWTPSHRLAEGSATTPVERWSIRKPTKSCGYSQMRFDSTNLTIRVFQKTSFH